MILWSRATEPELAVNRRKRRGNDGYRNGRRLISAGKRAFGKETKALFNLRKSRYTVEKSTGVNTNEISAMH